MTSFAQPDDSGGGKHASRNRAFVPKRERESEAGVRNGAGQTNRCASFTLMKSSNRANKAEGAKCAGRIEFAGVLQRSGWVGKEIARGQKVTVAAYY